MRLGETVRTETAVAVLNDEGIPNDGREKGPRSGDLVAHIDGGYRR
jgi:hypothetical protein